MDGKKMNDVKVKRKENFGYLVERRKMKRKKSERKKNENFHPIFFLSKLERKLIRQKLLKYNYLFIFNFKIK